LWRSNPMRGCHRWFCTLTVSPGWGKQEASASTIFDLLDHPRPLVAMHVLTGMSGFSYKEWKGLFYPSALPADGMLGYYASQFPVVEINSTFYRLPTEKTLLEWTSQVPERFRFAIKASRRITHNQRLQ